MKKQKKVHYMPTLMLTIQNQLPLIPYAYRGEKVACNLCGSDKSLPVCGADRRLKPLKTIACEQCGLMRSDPMPTDAELETYYKREYRFDYQFSYLKQPPRFHINRSSHEAEARFAKLAPLLKENMRILDFGSGSGEFLALAAKASHIVQGIEPDTSFATFARENYQIPIENTTWQKAIFPAGHFDLITANHVIEHLREPVSALKQIATWLAEDGILYVSVPNGFTKRNRSFQQFHFAHVHNFTHQSLIWAGMRAGLEPDPRFENADTTLIFRKRHGAPLQPDWGISEGKKVAAYFKNDSPARFLLSGRWILDAILRLRKILKDSK